MITEIINWNKYPEGHTNFICEIRNTGLWEEGKFGKWLCLFQPKEKLNQWGHVITAPTYHDILNLMGALLECENRNDNERYVYKNNKARPMEKDKKIDLFFKQLLETKENWRSFDYRICGNV